MAAPRAWPWLCALALLVLAMFGDVLLPGSRVLGDPSGDMAYHTLPWRAFGFGELAKGNLALWNPHVFGGAPFFGGMQSALLYPPNFVFLLLPLPMAVNWSVAIDFWLLGAFMYLWATRRGLAPFAAFVGAALVMFCAPHFQRLLAGLVTNVSAMAWVPLIFLCIDEWLASRRPGWCLLGMLAVALQIFAGQPQYVYYTALIAALYGGARLLEPRTGRVRAAAGLLSMYAGGALLAAVQLLPAMEATAETVRGQVQPYAFASSFSFPPESLVTLLVPGFFGDIYHQAYWGRWYLQDACAFMGVAGLALAAYGISTSGIAGKRALLIAAAAALVLALGAYTPLYGVLYDWLPMFGRFRASARFMYLADVVLALFACYGLDRLLRERTVAARALWIAGGCAAALLAAGAAVRGMDWFTVFRAMLETQQSASDPGVYGDAAGVLAAQAFTSFGLVAAGCTLGVAAALALWVRRAPRAALLLGALAVAEVFAFARMQRPTLDSAQYPIPHDIRRWLPAPHDYRIVNTLYPNGGVFIGVPDAWGYDTTVERRYAELVSWSQGLDPDLTTQQFEYRRPHPLLAMLRVKYIAERKGDVVTLTPGVAPPLRHVELLGAYELRSGREAVLRALGEPAFDPRRKVILEREPRPAPVAAAEQGRAAVVREGTDFLEIEADVRSPSVLLVTDAWSPAWRARSLDGAARDYEVVPANYALRGIALDTGLHRLRWQYAPRGFRNVFAFSNLAAAAWIAAALLLYRRKRKLRA